MATMTMTRILEIATPVLAACDCKASVKGQQVEIRTKKGEVAGTIDADGTVRERRVGKRNVLGALLKGQLVDALSSVDA